MENTKYPNSAIVALIFKKEGKQELKDDKEVNLLNTTLKLTIKIIRNRTKTVSILVDEQQEFKILCKYSL